MQCEVCTLSCGQSGYLTSKGLRGGYCDDEHLEEAKSNPKYWKNKKLRDEVVDLEKENQQLRAKLAPLEGVEDVTGFIEEIEEVLKGIETWANAYPVTVFIEPTKEDFKKAHEVLKANGLTIDGISASAMRHVLNGIITPVKEALALFPQTEVDK